MARGRSSPFAKGAGGKFVTLALEIEAEKANKEFKKLEKETRALKQENKKLSKALDEQTAATKKNEEALKRAKNAQSSLMDEQTKSIILLQGMTSALNQMTGATYKMIAGAEAFNLINEEQAKRFQESARRAELLTGALEFMLAIYTLKIAIVGVDTKVTTANTAATVANTKAQVGLNAALRANPVGMTLAIIFSLVAAFALLELKFGTVTKSVKFLRREIDKLVDAFKALQRFADIGSRLSVPGMGSNIVSMSKNKQYGGGLHPNPPGGF